MQNFPYTEQHVLVLQRLLRAMVGRIRFTHGEVFALVICLANLDKNHNLMISVEDLCQKACISRRTASRFFQKLRCVADPLGEYGPKNFTPVISTLSKVMTEE